MVQGCMGYNCEKKKDCCRFYENLHETAILKNNYSDFTCGKDRDYAMFIPKERIIRLPLGVGDTVYMRSGYSWKVKRIDIYEDCILMRLGNDGTEDYNCVDVKDLGEAWFFTKEEAQTAHDIYMKELLEDVKD